MPGARLPNLAWAQGRNAADSADVNAWRIRSDDAIGLGDTGVSVYGGGNYILRNTWRLQGRNAADSASLAIARINGSDHVEIGGSSGANTILYGSTTVVLTVTSTQVQSSQAIRVANAVAFQGRNNAGSADINIGQINTSDIVVLSQSGTNILNAGNHLILRNNWQLQGQDTGGTGRLLVRMNSSDEVQVGGASGYPTKIYGSTSERIHCNGTGIGFFAATPVTKPTVTGSRGGNAALADLLTDLASLGLITDSTSA